MAARCDAPVVFSALSKLGQICSHIANDKKKQSCQKKKEGHAKLYNGCIVVVVSEIPLVLLRGVGTEMRRAMVDGE